MKYSRLICTMPALRWMAIGFIVVSCISCFRPVGRAVSPYETSGGQINQEIDNVVSQTHEETTAYETEVIGKSVKGREITAYVFGDGDETVLIFSAIHGDEGSTYRLVENYYLPHLRKNSDLYTGFRLLVIPRMNPDGIELGRRQNAHGIDLNRNFKAKNFKTVETDNRYYGGEEPLSEPESRALNDLVLREKPARILTVHQPLNNINWDGPADDIAKRMHDVGKMRLAPNIGYPTPGSFGSWAGIDKGIPVITLELPPGGWEDSAQRDEIIKMLDVFTTYKTESTQIPAEQPIHKQDDEQAMSSEQKEPPQVPDSIDLNIFRTACPLDLQDINTLFPTIEEAVATGEHIPAELDQQNSAPSKPGSWHIEISRSKNRAWIICNQSVEWEFPVSTGINPNWTPLGKYKIIEKKHNEVDHVTGQITHRRLERDLGNFWMAINYRHPYTGRRYGLHGTDEPDSIGMPGSRGCIRFLNEDMEQFYAIVPIGAVVIIKE